MGDSVVLQSIRRISRRTGYGFGGVADHREIRKAHPGSTDAQKRQFLRRQLSRQFRSRCFSVRNIGKVYPPCWGREGGRRSGVGVGDERYEIRIDQNFWTGIGYGCTALWKKLICFLTPEQRTALFRNDRSFQHQYCFRLQFPAVFSDIDSVFSLLQHPCTFLLVIGCKRCARKGNCNDLLLSRMQKPCFRKSYQQFIRLRKLSPGLCRIDLNHILARMISGIPDGNRDENPCSFCVNLYIAPCKLRIGQPIAKGVARFHTKAVKPAIADENSFFIPYILRLYAKLVRTGVVRILLCPGGCQSAAGGLRAGQNFSNGSAETAAALADKDNCSGKLPHGFQIQNAAHIEQQHEAFIALCQQGNILLFRFRQKVVAGGVLSVRTLSGISGQNINCRVCRTEVLFI